MAILRGHVWWYTEIFEMPNFFAEPVLLFGFQDIEVDSRDSMKTGSAGTRFQRLKARLRHQRDMHAGVTHDDLQIPKDFQAANLVECLGRRGITKVHTLDHFDPRADLRYDMNHPVPSLEHARYGTLIDIGSLEHVFDTRQCMENCFRMVRPGGIYFLHTPVNGYYDHGLHTFNPEGLVKAFQLNGFDIVYHRYSTKGGRPTEDPVQSGDVLIWLVGRKIAQPEKFVCPQQGRWEETYRPRTSFSPPAALRVEARPSAFRRVRTVLWWLLPPIAREAYYYVRAGVSLLRASSRPWLLTTTAVAVAA